MQTDRKTRLIVRYVSLFIVIVICIVIFILSNQNGTESSSLSEKTLETIVDETKKNDADFMINWGVWIRKIAHVLEYFVLGIFLDIFFLSFDKNVYISSGIAALSGIIYAASDEIHQSFVPGRVGTIKDVLIDSSGVLIACFAVTIIYIVIKNNKLKLKS